METKYKTAILIIAIVIIFVIIGIFLIIWYKKKIKKNDYNLPNKFIGGLTLKQIIDQIKIDIDFELKLLHKFGIYNLTKNITHDLNIKIDYDELDIKPTKLKGGNNPDKYIIVNNKRVKLKDYLDDLIEKYQLNTEFIKMDTTNETIRFEEEYEEEEAEIYVEQSLRETERKYNEILDEISTQQELIQNSNISQEDAEKMNQQIQTFKEIDGKLKLIDTYYDDIYSMRNDLKKTTENIKQKRDDILKLIVYVELYYELEDLKINNEYITDDVKFEDNVDIEKLATEYIQKQDTFSSCDSTTFGECSDTFISLTNMNKSDNTCTDDECCDTFSFLKKAIEQQLNVCRDEEYLNEEPITGKVDNSEITITTLDESHNTDSTIFNKTYISNSFLMDLSNNFSIYDVKDNDEYVKNNYQLQNYIIPMHTDEINEEINLIRLKKQYINPLTKNKYTLKKMNTTSKYNIIFKHFKTDNSIFIFNKQKNHDIPTIFNKYSYNFDEV